ncbi:Rv2578c family radical SAM protein [Glutamicibacter sp. NPDC127525]|uniref:Rv2578c family radical SAM protein n=1 Tax=unclassified Glutamicibacter TaxID=2627139 RepID=UPI00363F8EC5
MTGEQFDALIPKPTRWDAQKQDVGREETTGAPILKLAGATRIVRTPEFAGVVFHEVEAKSALTKVPESSRMPFRWTINPYRGCTMGCRYCFARGSHAYLGLNSGPDFDQQIVVKTNIVDVLDRELTRKRTWQRELVALGTNTDPYQRAEGRYQFMPGIIQVLATHCTPFSILTKGTLIRRDIPALVAARQVVKVEISMSIAILDESLRRLLEPGAPAATARLETVRQLSSAGFDVTVFLMPVIPFLTDSDEQLGDALQRIKDAGASTVRHGVMHLRPGALESFQAWVRQNRPDLGKRYSKLFGTGANAPLGYRKLISEKVHALAAQLELRSLDDEDQPLARVAF